MQRMKENGRKKTKMKEHTEKCKNKTKTKSQEKAEEEDVNGDEGNKIKGQVEDTEKRKTKTRAQKRNKMVLERTSRLLSLMRHGPHWKRRVCCCVSIRYRGNVSTEPLSSNDRGIFTEPSSCLATTGDFYRAVA
jgi:hypothetical protein